VSESPTVREGHYRHMPFLTVPPQPGCPAGDPGVGLLTRKQTERANPEISGLDLKLYGADERT
jgi:hypothetical protein